MKHGSGSGGKEHASPGAPIGRARASRAKPTTKKATYATSAAIARLAFRLLTPGLRLSVHDVAKTLVERRSDDPSTKQRKAQRYLASLRLSLFNGTDHPARLLLLDKEGKPVEPDERGEISETKIREAQLTASASAGVDTAAGVLPTYLAFTALQLLETVLEKSELETLWAKILEKAPAEIGGRYLADFRRRFHAIPFAPKDYADDREALDVLVRALTSDQVVELRYGGVEGKRPKSFAVEPLSLVSYKGGLYLIGRAVGARRPIFFSVERILAVEIALDEEDEPRTFVYPADYSPEDLTRETFGILKLPGEKSTTVELLIHDDDTRARLEERTLHPSATYRQRDDGTSVLRMQLEGSTELEPWILGWGPKLTVLGPDWLRDRVEQRLREALEAYGD